MPKITVTLNGPYLVEGSVPLAHQHIVTNDRDESMAWREGERLPLTDSYALCRCGQSRTKPFCDGTHNSVGFDGTETASHQSFAEQAERIAGPTLLLDDAQALCAFARFCDPQGQVWALVQHSDPASVDAAIREAGLCPSGRLVARRRADGQAIEPHAEPSIGLVQDTAKRLSGPLWVRGGISVLSADGQAYEVRNRCTLCRCGASANKPFCDGAHAATDFNDRD